MTSEGLGEMFEGDSADTCAGKFRLVLMGAERRVSRSQTRERGPLSALAEIRKLTVIYVCCVGIHCTIYIFRKMCLEGTIIASF